MKLPALFSDHAVLQRDRPVPIWGWAEPGEKIKVTVPNQEQTAVTDATGRWQVMLKPMAAGGAFDMIVEGKNQIVIHDMQIGDVWLCCRTVEHGMERRRLRAMPTWRSRPPTYPNIRLITVATEGSQTPLQDFQGHWEVCIRRRCRNFRRSGYFFGRDMLQNVKVPIGLIDNLVGRFGV